MSRLALALAFCLLGCAWKMPPEYGAPAREVPADVTVHVVTVPDAMLQAGHLASEVRAERGEKWHVFARSTVSGKRCLIEVTDLSLPADLRRQLLAHERRHCAGQHHIWQDGKLVWLP